jgi:hypothetical protein
MNKSKPKVKKKNDVENFDFMKTTKDNIKNTIRDILNIEKINDIATKTNKIVIHTYQFLKLYLVYLYKNKKTFPTIDKEYICDVFKVLTIRKCGSGGYTKEKMPKQLNDLTDFYEEHYKQLMVKDDVMYYDKLSYILAYEAIDMETNINVNIQEHFMKHLNKFINISLKIKDKRDKITKKYTDKIIRKEKHKELTDEINKVKKDLTSFNELESIKKYHKWIKEQRKLIYNNKTKFENDNIIYDLKANTQDYFKSMFYICDELEKVYNKIKKKNENKKDDEKIKQIRLFNVLPLRTNIIGKNICIDSAGLISNFIDKTKKTKHEINKDDEDEDENDKVKNSVKYKNREINENINNIDVYNYKQNNNQELLWNHFFKLNKRSFKKNKYQFNYMIKTDGISVSILFIRLDANNKPMKKNKTKIYKELTDCEYIEKVKMTEEIKNKKVICIDPNKSDLIYCGSNDKNNNLETFRYTQNQRRLETRTKKYSKIIEKVNNETKINNQTIKQIESTLSLLNSKTVNYDEFKKYIIEKNKVNNLLFNHYKQNFFRKFKLNRYINTQKSEDKMIKNFYKKFGSPNDTIIYFGDYDCGGHNMKGVEPAICKKFRRIFKNTGHKVYLINEYCTSKLCNHCNCELEKFLVRKSNKPKDIKKNKKILVTGLLHHEDVNPKGEQDNKLVCKIIHNRDKNAVQNMINIVECIKKTGKRPEAFTRKIHSDVKQKS